MTTPSGRDRSEAELVAALGLSPGVAAGVQSAVCDFCERPKTEHPPRWYYPVSATMELPGFVLGSPMRVDLGPLAEGWVTCDQCHDYVERGDWEGLAEHIGYQIRDGRLPLTIDQFRQRRQGPAQPYTPPPETRA